ncbi:unnamed protein product [Microthlaspi erraticum]|uniref:Integrase catalytic domain-containing protein n=1 Tax=Microthlaspi erraticum TaxID=1685480 RepID=A0A6D2K0C7_9BRAS|nr:unnamed protein product [Microthlaspi erraticum]
MERIRRDFYWTGWKQTVKDFIANCQVCQKNKWETLQPAGLMQPLTVPTRIWADISMDFVEALPKVSGKTVILVVVDRFSKYAHFIPLSHPYTAVSVAQAFFQDIVRLHGIPETIVSDRDKVFRSLFWRELFRLLGTNLCFTTAYRPQSDGQTEVVNRTLEMYLRCVTGDAPRKWLTWLPWVEYCYNTSFHTSLKTTPFRLVYGRDPPRLLDYTAGSSQLDEVDVALEQRDEFLEMARERLLEAQQRMKAVYDNHHRALEFNKGDLVWLKIQPYRQLTIARKAFTKLSPKFYGPFEVLARIGTVSYRLQLPEGSRIHDVFHVSLLKPHRGEPPTSCPVLPPVLQGRVVPAKPVKLLRARLQGKTRQVLAQWTDAVDTCTWEDAEKLIEAYPELELEDKLLVEEGSNDTRYELVHGNRLISISSTCSFHHQVSPSALGDSPPFRKISPAIAIHASRLQAAKVLYLSSIDEPPNPTRLCLGDYSKSPKEYFLSLFFSKNRKYPFCLDNSKSPHPAQLPPLLDSSLTATSSHPAQHQSLAPLSSA